MGKSNASQYANFGSLLLVCKIGVNVANTTDF